MGGPAPIGGPSLGEEGFPTAQAQPPVVGQQPPSAGQQVPAVGQQPQAAGQQPAGAPSFGAPFDSYLSMVAARLGQAPTYVPELWSYVIVTKRLSAALANMHQFFVLTRNDMCDRATMGQFTNACVDWALRNYQGMVRGMQKGVAVYPVMCQTTANPEVVAYTKEKPETRFAAFTLACSYDLSAGRLEMLEKTPVWGMAMWRGVKKAATEALA
ncbi:MAG: hypothetical protein Q3979_00745 [Actinomycetaceae bacterium]|nr:hypothetical protein [Actinomycetaceae bacterium]